MNKKRNKKVQIGNCELYYGDCFDIIPNLTIKADSLITDPPFNMTNCEWDKHIPLTQLWHIITEKTKTTANYIFFASNHFVIELVNSKHKWYRYDLVWSKSNRVGFLNANKQPMRSHESILVFGQPGAKAKTTYNPIKTQGKPYIRKRKVKEGIYPAIEGITVSDGWYHPCSVLCFKSEKDFNGGIHPTLKPLELMEFLIKSYTNADDLVIDPFMGSGTTGIACQKLGRRFIGIEKEKQFFDTAVKRIKEITQQTATETRKTLKNKGV
jgi:site-specific DNA-methyltransferase (adenine-specific)